MHSWCKHADNEICVLNYCSIPVSFLWTNMTYISFLTFQNWIWFMVVKTLYPTFFHFVQTGQNCKKRHFSEFRGNNWVLSIISIYLAYWQNDLRYCNYFCNYILTCLKAKTGYFTQEIKFCKIGWKGIVTSCLIALTLLN